MDCLENSAEDALQCLTAEQKKRSYAGTQPIVPIRIFVIRTSEIPTEGAGLLIDRFAAIRISLYSSFNFSDSMKSVVKFPVCVSVIHLIPHNCRYCGFINS